MSKELQNVEAAVPAYLAQGDGLGTGNMDSEDISLPFLKLAQSMSEAVSDGLVQPGEFYDKLTGDVHGKVVNFFPLLFWRSNVWFHPDEFTLLRSSFKSVMTGEPFETGMSLAEVDALGLGIEPQKSYNYFILTEKEIGNAVKNGVVPMPTRWASMGASNGPVRQLNSKLKTNGHRGIPIYGQLIEMESRQHKFKKGSAFLPSFRYGRWASEQESSILNQLYKKAVELQSGVGVSDNLNGTESGYGGDIPE